MYAILESIALSIPIFGRLITILKCLFDEARPSRLRHARSFICQATALAASPYACKRQTYIALKNIKVRRDAIRSPLHNQRIHRYRAALVDDERIDVDLAHQAIKTRHHR